MSAGIKTFPLIMLVGGNSEYCNQAWKDHTQFTEYRFHSRKNLNNIKEKEYYLKAVYEYGKALENNDCNKDIIYTNRAALRYQFGDYNGALADYIKVSSFQSNKGDFKLMKAYCHLRLNQLDEAENLIDSIIESEETTEKSFLSTKKARSTSSTFPPSPPDYTLLACAFYYKGLFKYLNRQKEKACFLWSKASELEIKGSDPELDTPASSLLDVLSIYCK